MDFWGDVGQISAALGGLATIGVAAFGWKLWRATDKLTAATETANELVTKAAQADLYAKRRPKLDVRIGAAVGSNGDYATLYVRHDTASEPELIDELSVTIASQEDHGVPDEDRPISGPWRFKQGTDDADTYGRNAASRGPLLRGVQTRWALSRQADDIGKNIGAWGSHPEDPPCLMMITARIGKDEWRYTELVRPDRQVTLDVLRQQVNALQTTRAGR